MVRPAGKLPVRDFPNLTHDDLFDVMAEFESSGYYHMAVEELQRRFLENIKLESVKLAEATDRVETQVRKLNHSSHRIEFFSVALILLTLVLAVLEIVNFRREHRSASPAPVQHSAPPLHAPPRG